MTRAFVVIAVALAAAPAHAQPAAAQAEVLFRKGRALMAKAKFAEACDAFQESQKLDPANTTLIALATCREKNGQLATAWGLFIDAERATRGASDDATTQLHGVAQERAAKLEPRVSHLTIHVATPVDGLEIYRGKDKVDPPLWNSALPVDGGTYNITARAPGVADWSARIAIANDGDNKTVEIPDLHKPAAQPTPQPQPQPQPEQPQPEPAAAAPRSHTGVLLAGGAALALFGVALAFDLSGDSTYDDAKAETTDQVRRDSLYDSANQQRYIAEGLVVAGVGCAALAVYLYTRHHDEPATTARLIVTPFSIAGRF